MFKSIWVVRMKTKMPPKRADGSDIFYTPSEAVDPLLPYLRMLSVRSMNDHGRPLKIWECAAGDGAIVGHLQDMNFDVFGSDITNGFDFLTPLAPIPECDVLVTNPPYSIKDKWLARCFAIGKPFALLMPITALGEQGRVKMYKEHGIEILLLKERVKFKTPSGKVGGSWFYCAWFCWKLLPEKICFE